MTEIEKIKRYIDKYGAPRDPHYDMGMKEAFAIACQRQCDFVIFRRTGNARKWRVKVYSL